MTESVPALPDDVNTEDKMTTVEIILGAVLLVMSVFLIVSVLMQSGKDKGVSGTIAGGGSETFFGKTKGKSLDRKLSVLTSVVAIIFVLLVLAVYVMQDVSDTSGVKSDYVAPAVTTGDVADTGADTKNETAADTKDSADTKDTAADTKDTAGTADTADTADNGTDSAADTAADTAN